MQELKTLGLKRCYACIQWDGIRTYFPEKQLIKVDVGREGECRIHHKKVKGGSTCNDFYQLH